jgi:hypothetical protein
MSNVAVAPSSLVTSALRGVTVMPALSSSTFVKLTSAASSWLYRASELSAGEVTTL